MKLPKGIKWLHGSEAADRAWANKLRLTKKAKAAKSLRLLKKDIQDAVENGDEETVNLLRGALACRLYGRA